MTIPSPSDFPKLHEFDRLFREAIEEKAFSGAELLIGTPDRILLRQEWGLTRRDGQPIHRKTRFDLASLTKPLVTSTLCAWAVDRRIFEPDDSISAFFPQRWMPHAKKAITVRQLLNHCSGLAPYYPYYRALIAVPSPDRRSKLLHWILQSPLVAPPETESHYSDLGFVLLGMILEIATENRLDRLAHGTLFAPSGIDELEFEYLTASQDPTSPPEMPCRDLSYFAATEDCPWRKRVLQGEVHDENAYCLNGTAGHAGLFGTASGVYSLLSYLWEIYLGKTCDERFSSASLKTFWSRGNLVPQSTWALGFDTPNEHQSSAGRYFSPVSVGHLGFTGTSFWMDLEQRVMVVLLTNRVHPSRENDKIRPFRPLVHNLAMEAFHEFSKT